MYNENNCLPGKGFNLDVIPRYWWGRNLGTKGNLQRPALRTCVTHHSVPRRDLNQGPLTAVVTSVLTLTHYQTPQENMESVLDALYIYLYVSLYVLLKAETSRPSGFTHRPDSAHNTMKIRRANSNVEGCYSNSARSRLRDEVELAVPCVVCGKTFNNDFKKKNSSISTKWCSVSTILMFKTPVYTDYHFYLTKFSNESLRRRECVCLCACVHTY